MKKTLLYFEEYESELSHALWKRTDINVIFLRTDRNAKFFSRDYYDETARRSNVYMMFIDDNNNYSTIIPFKNWLEHHGYHLDYFLNDSEYYMEFSNKVAAELGLECLTSEQVKWVRDKVSMKDKFNEIGIKTVDYSAIDNKDDIYKFFRDHGGKKIVVKPRNAMNSIDVYMLETINDIDTLPISIVKDKYMVEVYCPYREWSIESLIQDGKVLDSYLTYIDSSTIEASINGALNCHMQLIEYPKYFETSPKEFVQRIVDGMNLKNGAMTIELFVSDDGLMVASEMGWRFPGCKTTTNISISRGFNMHDALIDIAIHKPVVLNYKKPITCPGDIYLPNKEGVIESFTSLEELSKMPGYVKGELFIKEGDYVQKRRVGTDASGWVIVQSKSPEETLNMMKNIYNNYRITVKEEEKGNERVRKI